MNIKLLSDDNTYSDSYDIMKNLLLYMILQFPISSVLKVYIGPLNIILTGFVFVLFFAYYVRFRMKKKEIFLALYIVFTVLQNIFINSFTYYEDNMLFYLPFLIFYFCFFVRNASYVFEFMLSRKKYIDAILIIWNIMVLISFAIPECYVYEGETRGFVSFAGSSFLLCPIAIYIFALLVFQYCVHRKVIYVVTLIVPSLCVLMGTTRTYLVVLFCAWVVFFYVILKNKKWFVSTIALVSVIFVVVVLVSPIRSKFDDVLARVDDLGLETTVAFTSGRSEFWVYDIESIFSEQIFNILFGNGVNYLFQINRAEFGVPLWAHNDFIQILSDYGLVGIGVYLYLFRYIFKNFCRNEKISKVLLVFVILMWLFNAFFNMFYTYFCAVLSFPFFMLIIKYDAEKRKSLHQSEDGQ